MTQKCSKPRLTFSSITLWIWQYKDTAGQLNYATPIVLSFRRLAVANGLSFAPQLFENEEEGDKGGRRRVVKGREAGCFWLGESLFLGGEKRGRRDCGDCFLGNFASS